MPLANGLAPGQAVTLQATVQAVSPAAGTPTGTVTFSIGSETYPAGAERRRGDPAGGRRLTVHRVVCLEERRRGQSSTPGGHRRPRCGHAQRTRRCRLADEGGAGPGLAGRFAGSGWKDTPHYRHRERQPAVRRLPSGRRMDRGQAIHHSLRRGPALPPEAQALGRGRPLSRAACRSGNTSSASGLRPR